jgi:hypothetical protein
MTAIQAKPIQDNFTVLADSQTAEDVRMTRSQQLFTSDWKQELLLAGYVYTFSVGTLSAGADVSPVAGGGNGTTIDEDQPELGFGVPTGYTLIPLSCKFAGQVDIDADAEVGNVVLFADLAATIPTDGTKTAVSPINLLHGATDYPGTAFKQATADITDPTVSLILDYKTVRAMDAGVAASEFPVDFSMNYEPALPPHFIGPCSVYLCWGGTAAVNGMANVTFAAVPNARFSRS